MFPIWGSHNTRDMCFPGREQILVGKCVFLVGEHISLKIHVSQVGEHLSPGISVSHVGDIYH